MAMSWMLQLLCFCLISQLVIGAALKKDIFLLAGESNMVGQGGVFRGKWDGYQPPEDRPDPRIFRLGPLDIGWQRAGEPLHSGIDIEANWGVGPGLPFARAVLKANASKYGSIGLVPCARSDSRIVNWSRGQVYYNDLIRRADESIQGGGEIRALLWYQGESDTVSKADVDGFKQNTENFFKDLRSDLKIPSLMIIQVGITVGDGNFTEQIRQEQMAINLPNVKLVDAKGLPLERDHQHVSTDGQVQLGQKLAHVYVASSGHLP